MNISIIFNMKQILLLILIPLTLATDLAFDLTVFDDEIDESWTSKVRELMSPLCRAEALPTPEVQKS